MGNEATMVETGSILVDMLVMMMECIEEVGVGWDLL